MTGFQTTGILSLDYILGGGWPQGRVSSLFGPRGSGRSTVALHAVAAAQRAGQRALVLHNSGRDADHAYALRLGADVWPTRFDSESLLGTLFDVFENAAARLIPELLIVELATDPNTSWGGTCGADLARFLRRFCQKPRATTLLFVTDGAVPSLEYFAYAGVRLLPEGEDIEGNTVVTAELAYNRATPGALLRGTSLQITPGDGVDLIKDLVRAAAFAGALADVDVERLCKELATSEPARQRLLHDVRTRLELEPVVLS